MTNDKYAHLLKRVEKPGRYIGGELNSTVKDMSTVDLRLCFCFPDTYEIGMSNLGMRILIDCFNRMDGVFCERSYAPWPDMEEQLIKNGVPLYALESGDPLRDFDAVLFTLQYELCYTNVLNMLRLAGMPVYAKDRAEDMPLVVAGGPCSYNPEPLADFVDIFSIGEGEEALVELAEL
ncbi:MAG: B12-binding domain-containing radical SAM protein, partial [Clostridia bacterium]|nr:B12-binding domain-containing radical SAM protein [Clostridia bacterium]